MDEENGPTSAAVTELQMLKVLEHVSKSSLLNLRDASSSDGRAELKRRVGSSESDIVFSAFCCFSNTESA